MKLDEIASAIAAHLRRFEADTAGVNKPKVHTNSRGQELILRAYYHSGAHRSGRYIGVTYITYQGCSYLTKAEAERYLAWLDAGNEGRHFEALRAG